MTLEETETLIQIILKNRKSDVPRQLKDALEKGKTTIGQFYDAVIEHANSLELTSDQWLDFHLKTKHWRLLREKSLMDKLSLTQRGKLGVVSE